MFRSTSLMALGGLLFLAAPAVSQAPADGYRFEPAGTSAETSIAELMADDSARRIVQSNVPALATLPIEQLRDASLTTLQRFAPTMLSAETLARIDAELRKLPPSPAAVERARRAEREAREATLDSARPWITAPKALEADFRKEPVALQFRRELSLPTEPKRLQVEVSADNRFVLYVNGARVAAGPSRGDLLHWRVQTIDLAPHLKAGRNVVAVEVWNDAGLAPAAQVSTGHTGMMLRAVDERDRAIDAGPAWQVRTDPSRSLSGGMVQLVDAVGHTYYVAGPPETVDGKGLVADWLLPDTSARDWAAAVPAVTAGAKRRTLVPDLLPQMRYEPVPVGRAVRAAGGNFGGFPARSVTIPANTEATLLVDAGRVMAAYPELRTRGGAGSDITLTYTEALYDPARKPAAGVTHAWPRFADRATVDNGLALGLADRFRPGGGAERFAPRWWRAWRFLELKVRTADQPVTLEGLAAFETGFPFRQRGYFRSDDAELDRIWDLGWRTVLFDAHETFMDTAYWEQLQYIGDTRIQALLTYDVAGDPRLAEQALRAFDHSRVVDGLPQAAWPSNGSNSIPPFALLWIGMLHDYWMRHPDPAVVRESLPGMRSVLDWYRAYVRDTGMLRATPGWMFVDWRDKLDGGADRTGKSPESCVIALQYVGALKEAADLEQALGDARQAPRNLALADSLGAAVRGQCWDQARGLFADTPEKKTFSQHANVLAVLHDVAPQGDHRAILDRITVRDRGIDAPPGVTGTTFYFSFYLARALAHAQLASRYPELMGTWRQLVRQNFTTWPENPDPSRSDSHAWSAHPTTGLLAHVAGIAPAAPGFARVSVTPHLGRLTRLDAAMAHPSGMIVTKYRVRAGKLHATIDLPRETSGTFQLGGREWPLRPGRNTISAAAATNR